MSNNKKHQLGIEIVKKLRNEGYQAYFAGGCVRDMLIGRKAKDYDVATNAVPSQVLELFPRTLEIGAQFGVIIVVKNKATVEVATFRSEEKYEDGRHPEKVKFTNVREDALRRDFTINGLYYDPIEDKVMDFVNGQADIKRKIIRAIGNPQERFTEDYLRILRAIRFSSQLDFEIEDETFKAVVANAEMLKNISKERIAAELEGILTSDGRIKGIELLLKSKIDSIIFKGISSQNIKDSLATLGAIENNISLTLALAAILSRCNIKIAICNCKSFKLSNHQLKEIKFVLENINVLNSDISLSRLKCLLKEDAFKKLCQLQKAIIKALDLPSKKFEATIKRAAEIPSDKISPVPLLNGNEIMAMGVQGGPELGLLAKKMYHAQLEEDITTPEQARRWINKRLKKIGL